MNHVFKIHICSLPLTNLNRHKIIFGYGRGYGLWLCYFIICFKQRSLLFIHFYLNSVSIHSKESLYEASHIRHKPSVVYLGFLVLSICS